MVNKVDQIDEHLASSQDLWRKSALRRHQNFDTYLLALFDARRRIVDVHIATQLLPFLQLVDLSLTGNLVVELRDQTLNPHLAFLLTAPLPLLGQTAEVIP